MANFFAELKRRHIYRVAAAYAVVAWVLIQIVNNVAPALKLPDWSLTLVVVLLAVGFPVALIFAWVLQLASAERAAQTKAGGVDWVLTGALAVVIALILYQQLAPTPGAGAARQASIASGVPTTAGISIAVLPFANMSGDAGQEFFSDGMTEEINGALAKVADLHVVARTSAFEFKGQNRDVRAVGQALGATHLIEGSVRKVGDRVRISAQLVRADNGLQLWSENYDRNLTDIFAIQEEIAQAIAASLRVPLGLQQGESLVSNRTGDLDSYQQYLHARALVRARTPALAISVLEPVVARDPNYAPAWALLSQAYQLLPAYELGVTRSGSIEEARRAMQASLEKAEMAALEAMRLDSRHAGGYLAMALVQADSGKWVASEDLFKQALGFDPNDPDTLNNYSVMLATIGRLKDALGMREKLRTLEPFVPTYNITTAAIMQLNGQGAASIPVLEPIPPDAAGGLRRNVNLARAYAEAGRYTEAADTLLLITGNTVARKSVEDAARLLRGAPAKSASPQALPVLEDILNFVYVYVGSPDHAMEAPERNIEIGYFYSDPGRYVWLPLYAPLRKTERFKKFVRDAGLVDYWKARGWPDLCRPMGANDFVCD